MNAEIGGEPASKKESMNENTVFNIGLTIDHIRHLRGANEGSISEVGKSIYKIMEARCKAYDLLEKLDKERQAARKVEIAEAEAVELLGRGKMFSSLCFDVERMLEETINLAKCGHRVLGYDECESGIKPGSDLEKGVEKAAEVIAKEIEEEALCDDKGDDKRETATEERGIHSYDVDTGKETVAETEEVDTPGHDALSAHLIGIRK